MTIHFRLKETRGLAADLLSLHPGAPASGHGIPLSFVGYVDVFCGWAPGRKTMLPTAGFPARRSIMRATTARRRAYERHRAARLLPHVRRLQALLRP